MRQSVVTFKSGDLRLEGIVGYPDGVSGPLPGVVICHPHPLGGGNMNNNLVLSVYLAFVENGFIALRFNFRGVGNSEGIHAEGEKEPEDAEEALNILKEQADVDGNRLGMAGYSFGTGVILRGLSGYTAARAFVLFSAPVRYLEYPGVEEDTRPKLFVCGDSDHGVPIASLKEKLESLKRPSDCQVLRAFSVVPGADHFWVGYEAEAAHQAVQFFTETLKQ